MALSSGLAGAVSMPSQFTYAALQSKYMDFAIPQARIVLGGKPFSNRSGDMIVGDINIELTSGFESAIARFRIFNVYDSASGKFKFDEIKSQVSLGTAVSIMLGYTGRLETVFVGFVAEVSFGYEPGQLPYVEITGMDVKGVMMAGTYTNQLVADNYGDAVREILGRTSYERLKTTGAMLDLEITDTPDLDPQLKGLAQATEQARLNATSAQKLGGAAAVTADNAVKAADKALASAKQTAAAMKESGRSLPSGPTSAYTVEMVSESDYEFVVKAAKKFNFEFFVDRGKVYFRKAKSNTDILMDIGSGTGIMGFNVAYSITGIVGSIEARAMDAGEGKVISSKDTFSNDLSTGSQARAVVSKGKKVLIDPTIASQAQADARVASLMEQMSYRLGTLEADCVGIPDLLPGRFIQLIGLGAPVDNRFYITNVVHDYREETGFHTRIVGRTDRVNKGGAL